MFLLRKSWIDETIRCLPEAALMREFFNNYRTGETDE